MMSRSCINTYFGAEVEWILVRSLGMTGATQPTSVPLVSSLSLASLFERE